MELKREHTVVNSYDKIPYISKSFLNTQAGHLKNVTRLFDFEAPVLENARVLELGCSFGGNLIPMAMKYPNMELIGFDLSGFQINEGNKLIEKLGLTNIHLEEKNILDYDDSYGKFDYIICHGVFSWVPKVVKDKILTIIKNGLSEKGLAVVSYNTNPGWKSLSILRDSMLFREKIYNENEKMEHYEDIVERGKKIAEFLRDYSVAGSEIKNHVENLLGKSNYYIYHEFYEECNDSFYLYEMQDILQEHGLTHICDSDIAKTIPIYHKDGVDMEAALTKECGDNRIAKEQYYDFLANQQFRSSIITHKELENTFHITRSIKKKNLDELYIRQIFRRNNEGKYVYDDGAVLSDELQSLGKYLNEIYPKNIKVKDLVNMDIWEDKDEIYSNVLKLIYTKKVFLSDSPFEYKITEKPNLKEVWRRYIKYFVEEQHPIISFSVENGVIVDLDKLQLQTLLELDGTKSKDDITKLLIQEWKDGMINIESDNPGNEEEALANYTDIIFFVVKRFGFAQI